MVVKYRMGDGHLILIYKDCDIVWCYIAPNIEIEEYKADVDAIMRNVAYEIILKKLKYLIPYEPSIEIKKRIVAELFRSSTKC